MIQHITEAFLAAEIVAIAILACLAVRDWRELQRERHELDADWSRWMGRHG